MDTTLTLRFSIQAQMDLTRISDELSDLQKQTASGRRATDLRGYAESSHRIITTQGLKSATDSRMTAYEQLEARFGVQALAIGRMSDAATTLAQSMRQAISADDGRGVKVDLELAFQSIVNALNQQWSGQPLFGGERTGTGPVKISSLNELATSLTHDQIYDEADRSQTVDLGVGAPIELADRASTLSNALFNTLRYANTLIQQSGGDLPAPLDHAQQDQLLALAGQLESHADELRNAEGRAGQLEKRFGEERERLQARSDLLDKEIGEDVDADLARVQIKLSALLVQYEASAKTFSEISRLSLLNFL